MNASLPPRPYVDYVVVYRQVYHSTKSYLMYKVFFTTVRTLIKVVKISRLIKEVACHAKLNEHTLKRTRHEKIAVLMRYSCPLWRVYNKSFSCLLQNVISPFCAWCSYSVYIQFVLKNIQEHIIVYSFIELDFIIKRKCLTMNTSLGDSPRLAVSPSRVCQNQEAHDGKKIHGKREGINLFVCNIIICECVKSTIHEICKTEQTITRK